MGVRFNCSPLHPWRKCGVTTCFQRRSLSFVAITVRTAESRYLYRVHPVPHHRRPRDSEITCTFLRKPHFGVLCASYRETAPPGLFLFATNARYSVGKPTPWSVLLLPLLSMMTWLTFPAGVDPSTNEPKSRTWHLRLGAPQCCRRSLNEYGGRIEHLAASGDGSWTPSYRCDV